MNTSQELKQKIAEISDGAALFADGLDDALVGFTLNQHRPHVPVYDADAAARIIAAGMHDPRGPKADAPDEQLMDDAWEFLEFNTLGAYVGPRTPLFIHFDRPPMGPQPEAADIGQRIIEMIIASDLVRAEQVDGDEESLFTWAANAPEQIGQLALELAAQARREG